MAREIEFSSGHPIIPTMVTKGTIAMLHDDIANQDMDGVRVGYRVALRNAHNVASANGLCEPCNKAKGTSQ